MAAREQDGLAEQAAAWIVRLSADDVAERQAAEQGFAVWKALDPAHAEAAARIEGVLGGLRRVRELGQARPARRALAASLAASPARRAKAWGKVALLCCLCLLPLGLVLQDRPPGYWTADVRSGVGEWSTTRLADGSSLALGSLSAVRLDFDARTRRVHLLQGDILVDVAHDAARPFVVETGRSRIRALGTRFAVRREAGWTVLTMLASRVEVGVLDARGEALGTPWRVAAGERLRIADDGRVERERIDAPGFDLAWARHRLLAHDMPLLEVLAILERQRRGRLLFDAGKLSGIRVSAVLPLDDTDHALQLLAENFPGLAVRRLAPYLVRVEAAGEGGGKK